MKVIIVGGGIGGLTTALMLHARGIDCEIYEQSDAIRELGVGINTLPHAIKELAGLGLLDASDSANFGIGCAFLIPIPWVLRWYTNWYVSQFALAERGYANA